MGTLDPDKKQTPGNDRKGTLRPFMQETWGQEKNIRQVKKGKLSQSIK